MASALIISVVLFGIIGWLVGRAKGRPALGAVLGAFFGIIGVIVIAVIPRRSLGLPPGGYYAPQPPPVPPPSVPAQWAPDPSGRHQYRWWDGVGWSDHVSDGGVESVDVSGRSGPRV